MAGINRLGKGPAKPGTMRPQDPNKYKTMDIFSEGTEGDKEYARMVQDIEDTQQNHSGWLFGRGAFDKGDLLYLRDEEEKRRIAEQELRDSEVRSFAKMRHKAEAQKDALQFSAERSTDKDKDKRQQAKALQRLIAVKPNAKVKMKKEQGEQPVAKKTKLEPESRAPQASVPVKVEPKEPEEGGNGLAGLLGGYGTETDEEEEQQVANPGAREPADSKQELLLLPDIQVKKEVKIEPLDLRATGPLTLEGGTLQNDEESDDSDSDNSDP